MSVQQAGTGIRVLRELEDFPLVEALFGRRSRRFARGGEIPDGPLAYRSGHEPVPLSELERMLVLGAMGGTTGWHFSITRHAGTRRTSRGSAQIHDPAFKACVARQGQYVFDTFGKFPGSVPSAFIMNYVQAHHLDPGFYDRFFKPGAYLRTHAEQHGTMGTPGRRGE
jgi:hypothetical protein